MTLVRLSKEVSLRGSIFLIRPELDLWESASLGCYENIDAWDWASCWSRLRFAHTATNCKHLHFNGGSLLMAHGYFIVLLEGGELIGCWSTPDRRSVGEGDD